MLDSDLMDPFSSVALQSTFSMLDKSDMMEDSFASSRDSPIVPTNVTSQYAPMVPQKPTANRNVYASCLPNSMGEGGMFQLFSPCGPIESARFALIPKDAATPNRGIGFVLFENPEDATSAVQKLNGLFLDTQQIVVRLAVAHVAEYQARPSILTVPYEPPAQPIIDFTAPTKSVGTISSMFSARNPSIERANHVAMPEGSSISATQQLQLPFHAHQTSNSYYAAQGEQESRSAGLQLVMLHDLDAKKK